MSTLLKTMKRKNIGSLKIRSFYGGYERGRSVQLSSGLNTLVLNEAELKELFNVLTEAGLELKPRGSI